MYNVLLERTVLISHTQHESTLKSEATKGPLIDIIAIVRCINKPCEEICSCGGHIFCLSLEAFPLLLLNVQQIA